MTEQQQQFLDVIDRDEAERRFRAALRLKPLGEQTLPLGDVLGRVLSQDVVAPIDVPSFDRSNFDGFAVQAADTFGAGEETPRRLRLLAEVIATAVVPQTTLTAGTCLAIATGGMLPRGADAILMVEHSDVEGPAVLVRRALTPGFGVSFAGTDISAGEIVLRRGDLLTSRETGVLAAIGVDRVTVWRQPVVGIISTGDEIIEPGQPMCAGRVYDSNARVLADAVRELGAAPRLLGIVADDVVQLRARIATALRDCDVLLLSGGTSKGAGDVSYRVVSELPDPGIVAHGVALKPGKPICLAVTAGKPVVILPGFPTSAIFTFHEFVAPVLRQLGGHSRQARTTVPARLAVKVNSEIGRTEYLLVGLTRRGAAGEPPTLLKDRGSKTNEAAQGEPAAQAETAELAAFPVGKGSGSVTTFSHADGFITIGRHEEILAADTRVDVQLLGRDLQLADVVVMGSHCVGLDYLLGRLRDRGLRTKFLAIGSTAGLEAVRRGECNLAGCHLLDPESGQYNRPFLGPDLALIRGYGRQQGLVFRPGDPHFVSRDLHESLSIVLADPHCLMVNRNQGSGTRILIDGLLRGARPPGYGLQPRSHNAVAAAVAQGRADWGVAIHRVAQQQGLDFLPLAFEQYDFVVLRSRSDAAVIQTFCRLLQEPESQAQLRSLGFVPVEASRERPRPS